MEKDKPDLKEILDRLNNVSNRLFEISVKIGARPHRQPEDKPQTEQKNVTERKQK